MHFVDHIAMIMHGQRQKNIIRYELKRKQTVYYPNNQVLQKYSFSVGGSRVLRSVQLAMISSVNRLDYTMPILYV